ncbi:hypothetical protein EW145_g4051 [Phellinidium pouzarii]|uniref:Adenosine deaminase n=1 Tax=Phellinidium pouzarii TaxID=167371 RepID=A0A4S4L4Y7_9AGAM|nr:hypothetical protein EW145_g4051 [Phellinidium pouzarii]
MSEQEAYLTARAKLIAEDRAQRLDSSLLQVASAAELRAEEIIRATKAAEDKAIWSVEHEGVTNTFAGMQFLSAKHLVIKSKLFQILTKMPKGGLLHAHLDAMVDVDFLLKLTVAQPAIHIRVPVALTPENIKSVLPEFRGLPANEFTTTSAQSLTASDYVPQTWVNYKRARETFSDELGGPEGFDAWITGTLTINPNEAYGTHNSVLKIWEKFASIFVVKRGLALFIPIAVDYIREFIRSSVEDGISYIETRIGFFSEYFVGADGQQNVPHREYVMIFERIVNEIKAELAAQGRGDEFQGARIIYSTTRAFSLEEIEWYFEDCIRLKQEFPHLIAGFDLVGNENTLHPLIYYLEPLLRFRKRVEELGLDLPFIFHAGETLGDGSEADCNLYDAVLLGTKRIGHGFSLVKHPKLVELVKEKGIAIERLTSSMPAHPLPILLNNGVSVALSSDDPAIFGNMGLSYDFFQVLVASEVNGLTTLKGLARQSVEYSTLTSAQKADALAAFERRWTAFVDSIVDGTI